MAEHIRIDGKPACVRCNQPGYRLPEQEIHNAIRAGIPTTCCAASGPGSGTSPLLIHQAAIWYREQFPNAQIEVVKGAC